MSYNVLIIPEDFTKDEHLLLPLVRKSLAEAGKPNATVRVCRDPNFQGCSGATDRDRIRSEVIERYRMVDLFILIIDRDGKAGREESVRNLVECLRDDLADNQKMLGLTARQEVEIFALAGHRLESDWQWSEIREEVNLKETYFIKLAEREGTLLMPHQGRKQLMAAAMKKWSRIKTLCRAEFDALTGGLAADG